MSQEQDHLRKTVGNPTELTDKKDKEESRPSSVTEAFHQFNQVSSLLDQAQAEHSSDGPNTVPVDGLASDPMASDPMAADPIGSGSLVPNAGDMTQPFEAPSGADAAENEQSIEQYMQQLLARSNGFSSEAGASSSSPSSSSSKSVSSSRPATPPAQDGVIEAAPEYVQKAAPERRDDLSSMRELANMSARRAIGTYSSQQLIDRMKISLFGGMGAAGVSIILTSFATNVQSLPFMIAAAAAGCGVLCTLRYLTLARQLAAQCRSRVEATLGSAESLEAN